MLGESADRAKADDDMQVPGLRQTSSELFNRRRVFSQDSRPQRPQPPKLNTPKWPIVSLQFPAKGPFAVNKFTGKRNTSLAFFTSHERSLLKTTWGSQATRLTRDSFLPFSSCRLCLLPSRSPVACAANGHIFCRECAMNNLLAQRKEIKRLEKESEKQRVEE